MIEKGYMDKRILLSFDIEEFDLPLEYGVDIPKKEMYDISKKGLDKITALLDQHKIKATFFVTASFAKKFPKIIKKISKKHEIASHGLSHSTSEHNEQELKKSKEIIEKILNKKINGLRIPKWNFGDIDAIGRAGFSYDSSSHPIYLPGKYFNVGKKRKIHRIGSFIEIPLSTLPPNLSIFWLAFKNFPLSYSKTFTNINFSKTDYTLLVMHPWEFANISKYKLPWYVNKVHGEKLLQKLEGYIVWCKKKNYRFSTIIDYLKESDKL